MKEQHMNTNDLIQQELAKIKDSKAAKLTDRQLAAIDEHSAKIKAAKASWTEQQRQEILEQQRKSRTPTVTSSEYRKKKSDISKQINQDPEYRKRYLEGNSKKYNNPNYWKNYYKGIAERDNNKEYHKKRIAASNAVNSTVINTPEGEFESISAAARHYGMTAEGMRNRVKSEKYPDFLVVKSTQRKNKS